jgi:hypothetical protein
VNSSPQISRYRGLYLTEFPDPATSLGDRAPELADEMDALIRRAWGDTFTYRRVIDEVFLQSARLTIVRNGDDLVAFSAHRILQIDHQPILHVAGTVVDPAVRDIGLMVHLSMRQVTRCLRASPFGAFGTFRSQNPLVVGANYRRWGGWPRPDLNCTPPPRYQRIATQVVDTLWPGAAFDPKTLVIRSAFPKELVAEGPVADYHEPSVNELCRSRLNLANGDAFLVLCRLTIPSLLLQPWHSLRRRRVQTSR